MSWIRALVPGLLAAIITMALTPVAVRLALRLRAVDLPGGRRRHTGAVPRLGGLAIVAGIVISLGPSLFLLTGFRNLPIEQILGFTAAVLMVFMLGLADDLYRLAPLPKLAVELLAAAIVVGMGWQFTVLRLPWEDPFSLGAVAAPVLSVIWIVGITNAVNFLDGLDGLAAGIVAIICGSLLLLALLQNNPQIVVATSCIGGASIGFLRHNWRPAKIYMGDSGSLTLGFILATISLRTSLKASAAVAILVPILTLGLPVFDTLLVMWYRFLRGHGLADRLARMFHADRRHLHHLLIDSKTERRVVMFSLYALALIFGLMALIVAASKSPALGLGFLAVEFGVVLLVRLSRLNALARSVAERQVDGLSRQSARSGATLPAAGEAQPRRPREGAAEPAGNLTD